jgi:hypothetical protein
VISKGILMNCKPLLHFILSLKIHINMARLIFPSDFSSQKKLSEAIVAKHNADAANSIIKGYLADNEIDVTKFATKAASAKSHDDARALLFGQSIQNTELRDVLMKLPVSHLKDCVQTLKKHYKTTPHKLADWGITVVGASKISYPSTFVDMSNLVIKFADKHLAFAAGTSPLTAFLTENEIDLAKDKLKVQQAIVCDTDADKKAEESAKETQLLNTGWQPVAKQLNDIGQYLISIFPNTPRKIIDWGFAVDENAVAAKEVNTKIKLGDKTTLKGVVIGSTLKNNGNTDLHIYKGSSTSGDPIIIKPGESFGIAKGYNTITVSNPSSTNEAKLSALRSV